MFPITLDHFRRLHAVLTNKPPVPLDVALRIVRGGLVAAVCDAVLCVCGAHVMVRLRVAVIARTGDSSWLISAQRI